MGISGRVNRIGLGLMIMLLVFSLSSCGDQRSPKNDSAQPTQQAQTKSQRLADKSTDDKQQLNGQIDKITKQEQLGKEEQVLVYLEKTVPEINEFSRNIESYNQQSNTGCRLIMRIDAVPDPQAKEALARDFYYIYVGSDMGTHTSRWNSFYVKNDLSEVLVEDIAGGAPMTTGEWRDVNERTPGN